MQVMHRACRRLLGDDQVGDNINDNDEFVVRQVVASIAHYEDRVYPHGDVNTNNLGHTPCTWDGKKGVMKRFCSHPQMQL